MKLYYSERRALPLPEGHRFPAQKYGLLLKKVEANGWTEGENLIAAEPASVEQLMLVHTDEYLSRLEKGLMELHEMRRIGFPWSLELVERSRRSVGASIAACRTAFQEGLAANLGGGTHHAFPDHGEGYCVFNDVAVAARTVQKEHLVRQVLILDCDVHQGNGTADIFKYDPSVFTFSIHGGKNFPFRKQASDLDVALPDGSQDGDYLTSLQAGMQRCFQFISPDLAIYIAGADPYSGDRLGRLDLSMEGLANRDRLVIETFWHKRIPLAIVMGGGYAHRVDDTAAIHLETLRIARNCYNQPAAQVI